MATVDADIERREATDAEIILGVLDAVERDPAVTQRSVAIELGIALGLVNAYLKRCVRKGLIKVSQVPKRRYAYYLTPYGFAEKSRLTARYLAHSFSFFRRARQHLDDVFTVAASRGQRRLVVVGLGDLAEVASLVAREHPIELVGIVAATSDPVQLEAEAAACGPYDGIVITALDAPFETHAAAVSAVGADRVHAPALLRIRPSMPPPGELAP